MQSDEFCGNNDDFDDVDYDDDRFFGAGGTDGALMSLLSKLPFELMTQAKWT